jgi:hypothetical protein
MARRNEPLKRGETKKLQAIVASRAATQDRDKQTKAKVIRVKKGKAK